MKTAKDFVIQATGGDMSIEAINTAFAMEQYARYYHFEKLKELTDELMGKHDELDPNDAGQLMGKKWAKQWYIKNAEK